MTLTCMETPITWLKHTTLSVNVMVTGITKSPPLITVLSIFILVHTGFIWNKIKNFDMIVPLMLRWTKYGITSVGLFREEFVKLYQNVWIIAASEAKNKMVNFFYSGSGFTEMNLSVKCTIFYFMIGNKFSQWWLPWFPTSIHTQ